MQRQRKIVCFANQKGGVGKTSVTALTSLALAEKGLRVLVIDSDPQANLTSLYKLLGNEETGKTDLTLYEVMKGEATAEEAINRTQYKNIDILPSSLELSASDMLFSQTGREHIVSRAIGKHAWYEYDRILIDTPPHLGILTINALTASEAVVVPVFPDAFSLSGLQQLYRTFCTVQEYTNQDLTLAGILISRMDNTNLSQNITRLMKQASEILGTKVYKQPIRKAVAIGESQYFLTNLFERNPAVAEDFRNFVEELEGDLAYVEEE